MTTGADNWIKVELEIVTELISRGITPRYTEESEYFVLNQKCIRNGTISYNEAKRIDVTTKAVDQKKFIKETDTLVCSTGIGTLGRVGKFKKNYKPNTTIDSHVTVIRGNKNINSAFLSYNLFWRQNEIESLAEGTTGQTELPIKKLGKLIINLPPLSTQKKIAAVLSALDDKIELNNKINQNLEQQAQAVFTSYFSNVNCGNSCIGNYIKLKRGKNLSSKVTIRGDVPVVAGGVKPAGYHNLSNTLSPVITIAASGTAGYINLWHIPVWSSDSSYIDISVTPYIYFWFILLKRRQQEIFDSRVGSVQPHIYPKHIEALALKKLDKNLVSKYNNIVTPLFERIGNNIKENRYLSQLRDTLLPKLMSGEIDVSGIEISGI